MDDQKHLQKSDSFLSCKIPSQSIHSHLIGIEANAKNFMNSDRESSPTCDPCTLPLSASFTDWKPNHCEKYHLSIGQHGKAAPAVTVSPFHQTSARSSGRVALTAEVAEVVEVSRPKCVDVTCDLRESLDESLSTGCTENYIVDLERNHDALFSGFQVSGAFHCGPDYDFSRVKAQIHEEQVANQTKQVVNDIGRQETIGAARSESLAKYYMFQEENENKDRPAKLVVERSASNKHICQQNERSEYIAMDHSTQLEALKIAQLAAAEEALVQKLIYQSKAELDKVGAAEEEMFVTAWDNSTAEKKHVSRDEKELLEEVAQKTIERISVGKEVLLKEALDLSVHDEFIQLAEECSIENNEAKNKLSSSQKENQAEEFLGQEVLGLSLQELAPRNAEDTTAMPYYPEQQSRRVDEDKSTEDSKEENEMDNLNSHDRNEMIM